MEFFVDISVTECFLFKGNLFTINFFIWNLLVGWKTLRLIFIIVALSLLKLKLRFLNALGFLMNFREKLKLKDQVDTEDYKNCRLWNWLQSLWSSLLRWIYVVFQASIRWTQKICQELRLLKNWHGETLSGIRSQL